MAEKKAPVLPGNLQPLSPGMKSITDMIGGLIGANDPTQIIPQPMVSTFIDRVPDRIAASTATQGKLLNRLMEFVHSGQSTPKEVDDAMRIASRYPRVLAHINDVTDVSPLQKARGSAGALQPVLQEPGKSVLRIGDPQAYASLPGTVAHELTHAAQTIGLKKQMKPTYDLYNRVFGYNDNPLETSARRATIKRVPSEADRGTGELKAMLKQLYENLGKIK